MSVTKEYYEDLSTVEALENKLVDKNSKFDIRVQIADLKVKKNRLIDEMAYEVSDHEHSTRCLELHDIDFKIKQLEGELNDGD